MNCTTINDKCQGIFTYLRNLNNERWLEEIASFLPQNLDEELKNSGSLIRFRGISDAVALLKCALLYAVSDFSFLKLATVAHALGLSSMSDTSWRKRILKLVPFLNILIKKVLASTFDVCDKFYDFNINLIDATIVRLQGKEQHQERLHVAYCLNTNEITQAKITDNHTAESLSHFSMSSQDLFMADAGYATRRNYAYVCENNAKVVLRITPSNFPVHDILGNVINYSEILPASQEKSVDLPCVIEYGKKLYIGRLIIGKIPEEKIDDAVERKIKTAQSKGNEIQDETIQNAQFVFLITNLDTRYSSDEILKFYRARWQIELLFKRFKQNFSIQTIRVASPAYAKVMVHLWLLIWLLVERRASQIQKLLNDSNDAKAKRVSIWNRCCTCFSIIKNILEMDWQKYMDVAPIEDWLRMAEHKRSRIPQNDYFRSGGLSIDLFYK